LSGNWKLPSSDSYRNLNIRNISKHTTCIQINIPLLHPYANTKICNPIINMSKPIAPAWNQRKASIYFSKLSAPKYITMSKVGLMEHITQLCLTMYTPVAN